MTQPAFRKILLLSCLTVAGSAHADYVGNLGSLSSPASVAFANDTSSHLSLSALPLAAPYNFIDRWDFVLTGDVSFTSLAAAFLFDDGAGGLETFGIANLQVNLLNAMGVVATGWQSVSTSGPFTQTISVTPQVGLVAGNYSLQVRGQLLAPPAAYSGSLIAAGVAPMATPLPAALPLLLAGLGAIGMVGRRRRD